MSEIRVSPEPVFNNFLFFLQNGIRNHKSKSKSRIYQFLVLSCTDSGDNKLVIKAFVFFLFHLEYKINKSFECQSVLEKDKNTKIKKQEIQKYEIHIKDVHSHHS